MARVKLGDVAREYKATCGDQKEGLRVVGLEHLVPQQIILTLWDEGKENTFTKMFKKGQVLFGRRRAYLKKAAVAPFDGICSGDITVIEAIPGKILPELLPFIIQNDTLFDFAVERSAGSLSPRVKWEHLKNFEFELPELDKQQELADILWASERAKTAYRELISNTDELVKSQFIEMFGDPITNPKGWNTKPLSQVAPERSAPPLTKDSVWLLNLDMIESNTGNIISKVVVPQSDIGSSTYPFDSSMVLYSKLRPYLNKVVVPEESGYATTELVGFTPEKTLLNKYFLAHLLRSNEFVSYTVALSGGTRMPRTPMSELRKFACILPPIEIQERFVSLTEQFDKSKFVLQETLKYDKISYFSMIKSA